MHLQVQLSFQSMVIIFVCVLMKNKKLAYEHDIWESMKEPKFGLSSVVNKLSEYYPISGDGSRGNSGSTIFNMLTLSV